MLAMDSGTSLGFLTRRAYFALRRRIAADLVPLGLTAEQYSVIFVLDTDAGLRQRDIAERLYSDANTITSILRRLEQQGWVTREADPRDRRAMRVRLTEAGRVRREEALAIAERTKERAMDGFSPDERRQLVALLERVYRNATAEQGEPA